MNNYFINGVKVNLEAYNNKYVSLMAANVDMTQTMKCVDGVITHEVLYREQDLINEVRG
jgi:hypothetical protein